MKLYVAILGLIFMLIISVCYAKGMNYGSFVGDVEVRWCKDGRNMELLKDFSYIDPVGKKWTATKGYKTDGASIPQVFWSIVGGPFEGPYREAAVIHDMYCDIKTEPWVDVHRIFYYANRAAGVPDTKAKLLYTGVMIGGPKWGDGKSKCRSCHKADQIKFDRAGKMYVQPNVTAEDADKASKWIEANNPTLEQIDNYVKSNYPKSTFGHSGK
jgi:hypothetical protein